MHVTKSTSAFHDSCAFHETGAFPKKKPAPHRRSGARALGALGVSLALITIAGPAESAHPDEAKRACIAASTQGQTLRSEEKLLAARDQMLICARDACPTVVRTHCAQWLAEIDEKIPSIVIRPQDSGGADVIDATVTIDGHPAKLDGHPVSLDPGAHVVVVERSDGTKKEEHVLLADKEKSRLITIAMKSTTSSSAASGTATNGASAGPAGDSSPDAEPRSGAIPTGAWVLGAVGVVALGSFAYFGLSAKSDLNSLKGSCSPNCTSSDTSGGRTKALVADISLGAGVLAIGGAVIWAIVAHSKKSDTALGTIPMFDVKPMPGGAYTTFTAAY